MRTLTLTVLLLALAVGGSSRPTDATEAPTQTKPLQRIILIRHGIRSPTKAPDALAVYADNPWPTWPVAPGQLTPHGIDTLRSLGKRMGQDLAAAGLPHDACKNDVHVIADSTPRNRASAVALVEGLSPGCTPAYQAFPAGQSDPLFHGAQGEDDDDKGGIDVTAILPATRDTLAELQQVLLGCRDDACLAKASSGGKKTLLGGDIAKALKTAGSLSENIMLAYVQGMPEPAFAWGRLDAAGVSRIVQLHNASFQLAHATPEASRSRGGNMLAHITATLAATAGKAGPISALAPAGTRVLVLVGHDTDLAAQAGLLGLGWHDATGADDYPPGGALIYDLVQTSTGKAVRVSIAMPTLAALRAGDMTPNEALARKILPQPACGNQTLCPLDRFVAAARGAFGSAVIVATPVEPLVK